MCPAWFCLAPSFVLVRCLTLAAVVAQVLDCAVSAGSWSPTGSQLAWMTVIVACWLAFSTIDSHGRSAYEFCFSSGCNQLIDEPTHISGNSLDLVFSDMPSLVSSSVGAFIGSSDHCHLNIKIEVNQHIPNCTFKKTVWLKSRANWDALAAECDAIKGRPTPFL